MMLITHENPQHHSALGKAHACTQREHYGWGRDGMALVRLQNCTQCSLTGAGTLDGRGRKWVSVRWPTRKLTR